MAHSNSSLNCFANCMAKYEHNYILHTPPCKPISPHLTFGTIAHEVLYNAGKLRDNAADGIEQEYETIIPSELMYPELKQFFKITDWRNYFTPIISKIAEYEKQIVETLGGNITIERELKLQMTVEQLQNVGYYEINNPLVGVIDLLVMNENSAFIVDYKFSTKVKGQDEFDMNSQLQLYAFLVHYLYDIPLHNIRIAYMDIPKQEFSMPNILKNGTLSRAKSQNVSQENYQQAVWTQHGDDPYYNCDEGGYYYETYCALAYNKPVYFNWRYVDMDVYEGIVTDLLEAARMIDIMKLEKLPFLKKYDSYSCANCEFITACKPWVTVEGGNE